jgi:hypothetical protein
VVLTEREDPVDKIAPPRLCHLQQPIDRLRIEELQVILRRRCLDEDGFGHVSLLHGARREKRADAFGELFHRERLVQNGVHSGGAPGLRPGAGGVRGERDLGVVSTSFSSSYARMRRVATFRAEWVRGGSKRGVRKRTSK